MKTNATIKLTHKGNIKLYEEVSFKQGREYMEKLKNDIDLSGMSPQTRKMFANLIYGV